jgi:hypothetical protein
MAIQVDIESKTGLISQITDIGAFVSRIVGAILIVASLLAFLYLVWGGVQWILAGSDTNKVEEARHRITNAMVGLAIVAVAWAIFLFLDHFLGLGIANQTTNLG